MPADLVVAPTGQSVPGLQHIDLKAVFAGRAERNPGREIEPAGKDADRVAVRHGDVLTVAGIEQDLFAWTQRIADVGAVSCKGQGEQRLRDR